MTTLWRKMLMGGPILIALAAALGLPLGAAAAPPAQQPLLFDQEFPVSVTLNDATPQLSFSLPCTQSKVASVYIETTGGDLAVEATVLAPNGSPFAIGGLVSSNPNVTAAEAFIMPATGTCTLTLNRVGATAGRADLRLLSGYAHLSKWEAFDGIKSPLRMSWEPYVSENMDVRVMEDDRLRVQVIRENLMGYAMPSDNDVSWGDMYIQADFVIDGSPSYFEYGFVLRADDDVTSFYSVTLSSDGDYSVYYYNGDWTAIQDWTVSDLLDGTDHQPHLGVWAQGNTFRIYYRDQFIAEVTDPNHFADQGIPGLAAATGVGQADPLAVFMDNVVITTPIEGAPVTVTPPLTGADTTKPTPTTSSGLSSGLFGGATKEPTLKPPAATLPPIVFPTQPPPPTLNLMPPTPFPTDTEEPVQGLVLNNWSSSQPSDILRELLNYGLIPSGGSLQIDVPNSYGDTSASGFSYYSLGRGQTFRNFVLSFDATLVDTGPESGCGMYFRDNGSTSDSALVMEDGSALLGEWDTNGDLTDASFFDYHDAIRPGRGATNRVIVVAVEESVLLYINGELVTAVEFTPQSGEIALEMYVASDDFGNTVETYCQLQNIWLWQF